jgi:transcriptional regulator with XRE-family HTH domain
LPWGVVDHIHMEKKTAPNPTDVIVGSRVRLRRMELGFSQTKLADALGITFQQVQKYERGTNRIGASRLLAIAKVLAVEIGYFFPAHAEKQRSDQSEIPSDITKYVDSAAAFSVLRNFSRISNPALRNALRVLMSALATRSDDGDTKSSA